MNRRFLEDSYGINTYQIQFSVSKKVKYGQGLFVCGSAKEIGEWNPENSLKLRWTDEDKWTGVVQLKRSNHEYIQFKYIISDFDNPSKENTQWQIGQHNRIIQFGNQQFLINCDNKWNIDKISIILKSSNNKAQFTQKYYVIGDVYELGSWNEKKQMKKVNRRNSFTDKKQNIRRNGQISTFTVFHYNFEIYRGKEEFTYYFIKKTEKYQSQNKPYRCFKFNHNLAINKQMDFNFYQGYLCLNNQSRINQLLYSKITEDIFVGSYPKSSHDIQQLKSHNISAILSIQSDKDFKNHGITSHYINLLCNQNGIKYKKYSIQDMNSEDFVTKAQGAVNLLNQFVKNNDKVYIHCTAGKYRSPQTIALYLILHEHMEIEQACCLIKQNHPQAKPNYKVIRDSMQRIKLRRSLHKLYV